MLTDQISVLLVEDSDTDADLTEYRLKKAGLAVLLHRVRDGEECMDYLRNPAEPLPDIVFLDLNMPKKDGREVLGEMMADSSFHKIPVVIMTSSDLEADKEKAYALGANGYVVKPGDQFEYERMMGVVDKFWLQVNRFPVRKP